MAMTDDERAARLAAIRERAEQAAPGPWRWRGNISRWGGGDVYLSALVHLRPIVMTFRRWGMQDARPVFRDAERDLLVNGEFVIPYEHHPWEIGGIDHPDARFIERSREDIDWLLGQVGTTEEVYKRGFDDGYALCLCHDRNMSGQYLAGRLLESARAADRLPHAMAVIRRLWRKRSACIASNEAQWHVINEGGARERALRAALAALVADDFDAWTSDSDESHWQCTYCHAHSTKLYDEPRVADHKADCPWLAARAMVGHVVPVEESEPDEDDEDASTMMQILRDDGEFMAQLEASGAGNTERVIRDVAEAMKVHLPGILRAREEGGE
jgi:hypothetical protein